MTKQSPMGTPQAAEPFAAQDEMSWRRYGRQMLLPEIGEPGQQLLGQARVLIVGLGGLGSPAALYLAAGGVGQLWLSDDDVVATSNLQRQILYTSADLQQPKRNAARKRLAQLNPNIRCYAVTAFAESNGKQLLQPDGQSVDLVLDCSDNMVTRQLLNRCCVELQIPLLSAAVSGWQGSLLLFDYRANAISAAEPDPGCYHCLYPLQEEPVLNCQSAGIIGPLAGMLGSWQALEAMKFLLGLPSLAVGHLQQVDGLSGRWQRVALRADPCCPVCQPPSPSTAINHEMPTATESMEHRR